MPFSILYVCTGNICRSPFAELLTRALLDAALGHQEDQVSVASAGTCGMVGHAMDATAAAELRARGVDADGFRARALRRSLIQDADLVLTATLAHRQLVLEEEPRALRRTFTIREFADLVRITDPAASPQELVSHAAAMRGRRWRTTTCAIRSAARRSCTRRWQRPSPRRSIRSSRPWSQALRQQRPGRAERDRWMSRRLNSTRLRLDT